MATIYTYSNGQVASTKEIPDAPKSWDAYDFKMRFTASERKAIRAAAALNEDVEDFLDMLNTAAATGTRIKADDEFLNAALDALEGSLIAVGRKAEIIG